MCRACAPEVAPSVRMTLRHSWYMLMRRHRPSCFLFSHSLASIPPTRVFLPLPPPKKGDNSRHFCFFDQKSNTTSRTPQPFPQSSHQIVHNHSQISPRYNTASRLGKNIDMSPAREFSRLRQLTCNLAHKSAIRSRFSCALPASFCESTTAQEHTLRHHFLCTLCPHDLVATLSGMRIAARSPLSRFQSRLIAFSLLLTHHPITFINSASTHPVHCNYLAPIPHSHSLSFLICLQSLYSELL